MLERGFLESVSNIRGETHRLAKNFRNAFDDKLNRKCRVVKEKLSFGLRVVRFKKVLIHAKTPILGSGSR